MTEAEALDEAAKVVGCGDWGRAQDCCFNDELNAIRAHAKTIMENAALEAKLADVSKALMATAEAAASSAKKAMEAADRIEALEAEVERLREALKNIVNNCGQCGGYGTYPEEETVTGKVLWSDCSSPQCKEARTALERIDHGDR